MTPPRNRSWVPGHGYQNHHNVLVAPFPFPPGAIILHPAFAVPPVPPPPPPPPYTANAPPAANSAVATVGAAPAAPPAPAPLPGTTLQGGLMSGAAYMYPPGNTSLHVIHPLPRPPWTGAPQQLKFVITKVPTLMTVKDVIKGVLGDGDNHTVTEALEYGEGQWQKGMSIRAGDGAKSGKTLKDLGWDERRGEGGRRPVWAYFERG